MDGFVPRLCQRIWRHGGIISALGKHHRFVRIAGYDRSQTIFTAKAVDLQLSDRAANEHHHPREERLRPGADQPNGGLKLLVVAPVGRPHIKEIGDPKGNLRRIGVDEISHRTCACGEDRGARDRHVQAFIKAVKESVPNATLIFDRFHVQRRVHDALDEVRRDEVRSASSGEKADLKADPKRARWLLQKRPWNLSELENAKLVDLEEKNLPIYRAYLLKESLATILDGRQINVARRKLDEWIEWARSSGLPAFTRAAGTIEKYREGILAYVRTRLNNGRVGRPQRLTGKTRVITRRAFGFHSASSLISMTLLCCGGIETGAVLPGPRGMAI